MVKSGKAREAADVSVGEPQPGVGLLARRAEADLSEILAGQRQILCEKVKLSMLRAKAAAGDHAEN